LQQNKMGVVFSRKRKKKKKKKKWEREERI
jgi:hypothetical protein